MCGEEAGGSWRKLCGELCGCCGPALRGKWYGGGVYVEELCTWGRTAWESCGRGVVAQLYGDSCVGWSSVVGSCVVGRCMGELCGELCVGAVWGTNRQTFIHVYKVTKRRWKVLCVS